MSSASLPLIPEIVRLICEQIEDKHTLTSLARTCAAFENPALDALWFNIRGLYCLVKCLPSELWTEVERKGKKQTVKFIVLRQALAQKNCNRLIQNAKRVRMFDFEPYHRGGCVDVNVYEALQAALPGLKLLPNVRSLTWSPSDTEPYNFSFIHMFMGPHITEVEITFPKDMTRQLSLLPTLLNVYPTLKHIKFYQRHEEYEVIQAVTQISSFVYQWRNLESLDVSYVTWTALKKVSLLPNLKSLLIGLLILRPDTVERITQRHGFPVLRRLYIQTNRLAEVIATIQLMDSSPLVWLKFSLDFKASPESWRYAMNVLREHCCHNTLRQILTSGFYGNEDPRVDDVLTIEDIQPLFAFRNLINLDFSIPQGIFLSRSTDTEAMAQSWPYIIALKIRQPSYLSMDDEPLKPSKITLVDLLPFDKYCPNLRTLALPLDATSPPEMCKIKPEGGISQTSLRYLDVNDSPAKNPIRIASFLSSVFPSLRDIESLATIMAEDDSDAEDTEVLKSEKPWICVRSLLYAFSTIREQERSYIKAQYQCECDSADESF